MTPEERFEQNIKLVYDILNKKFPEYRFDEDFQQIAMIGLWKACLSYDESNYKFTTYAYPCIRNEILMELRKSKRRTKQVSLEYLTDKIDDHFIELSINDPDYVDLEPYYRKLNSRRRVIIECLYEGMSYAEIAKYMGYSRAYIYKEIYEIRKIFLPALEG